MKLRNLLKVIDCDVAVTLKTDQGNYERLCWSCDSKLFLESLSYELSKYTVLDVSAGLNDNFEPIVGILVKESI